MIELTKSQKKTARKLINLGLQREVPEKYDISPWDI
jgi:hypothetical protein